MSDITWRDRADIRICPDPDEVGCKHWLGAHDGPDGCLYTGAAGWCGCTLDPLKPNLPVILDGQLTSDWWVREGLPRFDHGTGPFTPVEVLRKLHVP